MERRKVQVTGGSTYTVSLPKEWAEDNDVEAGTELAMFPRRGSIVAEVLDTEGSNTEGVMDITDVEGDHLVRAVITMYVAGFDVIRFEGEHITGEQRRVLRETGRRLSGLEVVEETRDVITFHELLDSSEISLHRTVSRMRLIVTGMFEDAVSALVDGDEVLAEDVVERDDEPDRMFAMVNRIFRASLRDLRSVDDLDVTREECFDYYSAARQLERIADHSTKIAEVAVDMDRTLDDEVAAAVESASDAASSVVEGALESLLEAEKEDEATELANDALDSLPEVERRTKEADRLVRSLEPEDAQLMGLVVDSIGRTADYGANVGETALQSAAPEL